MPGWEKARLDDACIFLNGLWKGKKPPFVEAGVIRNTNFAQDGALDFSDIAYLDVEEKQIEKRRLQLGDIILEKSGGGPKQAVGRVALFNRAEENFSFSNFTSAIRIRDAKKLDYRYLHKYLHWIYVSGVTESMQSHSTGIRNLNGNAYKNIEIAIPALKEQQRIVAILDEAFAGIATAKANAEKNLQNARELFDIHLQEVFSQRGEGWCEKSFVDLCSIESNLVDPRQAEYMDLLHVGGGNIEAKTGALIGLMSAKEEGLISGKFLFDEATVLYSKIRPYLMKVVRPNFSGLCSADIYPLTPNPERITRNFLFYLLLSPQFTEYAIAGSARAGMPKVNREHLFDYRPWVPIPSVQSALTSQLDAIAESVRALDGVYRRKLAALDELKQSLLAKAFAGELT